MRSLLASPLGFLVGLSLGALGGGGSILAVPALVHGVGEPARAATTTSLVVVGFASLIGVIPHWRRRHVRLGAGVLLGAAGIGGSVLGTALNRGVDPDVLLVAFSAFMVLAGVAMLRRSTRTTEDAAASSAAVPVARFDAARAAKVIAVGTAIGALTGFFGVGGGFVIVPGLVVALGLTMPEAVGTSLVVITINAAVALVLRVGESTIDWGATIPFLVAAVIGTIVGGRIAERVDPHRLTVAFVALLAVVAIYTGTSAVVALVAG